MSVPDDDERWSLRREAVESVASAPFPWSDDNSNEWGDDYDWYHVFSYAGPETCVHGDKSHARGGTFTCDGVSSAPFQRSDVAMLVATSDGSNDDRDWLALGALWDGRWFFVKAGCDYTGWG